MRKQTHQYDCKEATFCSAHAHVCRLCGKELPAGEQPDNSMKTTLKSEGYAYLFYDVNQCHVLYNINTGEIERYINTPNFAGYTLKYKNTRLEFCNSYSETETAQLLRYMLKVQRWGEQHPLAHSTMMNVYRNYIAN